MFVRTKTTPNSTKTAVQLVENKRIDGKVKQRVVRHFGYGLNAEEINALKAMALKYKQELIEKHTPTLFGTKAMMDTVSDQAKSDSDQEDTPCMVDIKKLREKARINIGIHQVYGNLFDSIGLYKCMKNPSRKYAAVNLMKNIVLSRILKPGSKRSNVRALEDDFGISVDLNSVYRMMDYMDDDAIDKLQKIVSDHTRSLIPEKIDVLFYDCTTLYFESFDEDELKEHGYSKDGKFNQNQVLLALLVTHSGLPIGYEVFAGSMYEGHTLRPIIEQIAAKHDIQNYVLVADSAMLNKENIQLLKEFPKVKYMVGARIKNMAKDITAQILDKEQYKPINKDKIKDNDTVSYRRITLPKDTFEGIDLVVTHSAKRARKDAHDRDKAIEKVRKKFRNPSVTKTKLTNRGYAKFLKLQGESKVIVDESKIEEDQKWDGLHGVLTNDQNIDVDQILAQYKGLWQVEETFRVSKHDMRIRPIFHWNPRRIKAHIALCFMALTCIRTLEYKTRLQYRKLSPKEIHYHISRLQASIIIDQNTSKQYILPSCATQEAKKIYEIIGLRWSETPYPVL